MYVSIHTCGKVQSFTNLLTWRFAQKFSSDEWHPATAVLPVVFRNEASHPQKKRHIQASSSFIRSIKWYEKKDEHIGNPCNLEEMPLMKSFQEFLLCHALFPLIVPAIPFFRSAASLETHHSQQWPRHLWRNFMVVKNLMASRESRKLHCPRWKGRFFGV